MVIIEDIDRFYNVDIFTKLRELNTLINNSNSITRHINFVYAIRDDIFSDKNERSKFFDYIIPIVPFVNPSNARDQLTNLMKDEISKGLERDITTLIHDIDMRLLINIVNEYKVYKKILKSDDLDKDKLFSIITYKNLYPGDFSKLQKHEGNVYSFLNGKEKYIAKIIKDLQSEMERTFGAYGFNSSFDFSTSLCSFADGDLKFLYCATFVN